ncbi:Non-specific lipid-transfer protein 2B [Euphorbia peplus]|nr:Non-specific lipid-transfer protein 2B [Euphorbia peplus]
MTGIFKLPGLILVMMVVATAMSAEAKTCYEVRIRILSTCMDYLRKTCICLKCVISQLGSVEASNLPGLPTKCGVSFPYEISPENTCDSVELSAESIMV